MSRDIYLALKEIESRQRENLQALEEIQKQSEVTLEDLEAIQERESELTKIIGELISEQ